ncbi:MAG: FAD-dependent oxidoreductase, partial [Treponemataceae bacterium]
EIHGTHGKETEIRELSTRDCYHVPYRCVIAKDFDNLFIAGRCFSANHPALSAARNISYCMALGQSTGNAAAQLVKRGKTNVRDIDIAKLQDALRDVI